MRRLFLPDLGTCSKTPAEILANVCSRVSGGKSETSLISTSPLPFLCLTTGFGSRLPVKCSKPGSVLLLGGEFLHEREFLRTGRPPNY